MAILPIYIYEQPVLRRKAKPVNDVDDALIKLTEDMFETMHNAFGVGLAATQVGSLQRVAVLDVGEEDEGREKKPLIVLNPEIVREDGSVVMEEGCLSLPDLRDDVDRPSRITVRYRDLAFQEQEIFADGLLARALQHEIDHLNGVLFIDHIGLVRRKLMHGRLNKMKRGQSEAPYPVVGGIEVTPDPTVPRKPTE